MSNEPNVRLARLRAGTAAAHARIETVPALARLLADDLTRDEYVAIVRRMQAFHYHFEPAIAAALESVPQAAALLDGSRPRALAEDLGWFGATAAAPPALPELADPAAALGALYVIEGSGLGGRVIGRHLAAVLGVGPSTGGSFYCRLDADTARRRWHYLAGLLGAADFGDDAADDRMVDGALAAFSALETWLRCVEIIPETTYAASLAEAGAP